ncbi:hypothetical protein C8J57DRAFT_1212925 [Mycena rebaudengoi]|nr:hypothetical protein C8J57DRAFT_1212925 [Mycena rebaudengoi]
MWSLAPVRIVRRKVRTAYGVSFWVSVSRWKFSGILRDAWERVKRDGRKAPTRRAQRRPEAVGWVLGRNTTMDVLQGVIHAILYMFQGRLRFVVAKPQIFEVQDVQWSEILGASFCGVPFNPEVELVEVILINGSSRKGFGAQNLYDFSL